MKKKILYLSYNGMLEPLGASQVLSYLYYLSDEYEFHLISVEKNYKDKEAIQGLKNKLNHFGIHYYPIEYKSNSIEKPFNIFKLLKKAYKIIKKENIKYIHSRAYPPTIAAYLVKKHINIKYLFDTRGFGFDERADTNQIKRNSFIYKFLKKLEIKLYNNAAAINMLSYEGKRTLQDNELYEGSNLLKHITVIPTCVDLNRFKLTNKNYSKTLTIGYVGNTVGWYDFDKTLAVVSHIAKFRDYKFLIFNNNQHDYILEKLKLNNIPFEKVRLESVAFEKMPERLKEIDLSIFYIKPLFSKKASAATKLAEFFACGIPVITNAGIGDHEYYVEKYKTGKILSFDKLEEYDYNEILNNLLSTTTSKRCRKVAEEFFSVERGAIKYSETYKEVFNFE